jgi:hypothetical protein
MGRVERTLHRLHQRVAVLVEQGEVESSLPGKCW